LAGEEYKMQKGLWTKGLVLGIICLFVGTYVFPTVIGSDPPPNQPLNENPIAEIVSIEPNPGYVNQQINFTGRGYDPEGDTKYFSWDFNGDGTWEITDYAISGNGWRYHYVNYTYNHPNNYTLILKVRDVLGAYNTDIAVAEIFIRSPLFGTPSPANGSTNNPVSFTWSILISQPDGEVFDWSIQCSNGQTNGGVEASNGTKSLTLSGLTFLTTYMVWVNATTDPANGYYTRMWYTFTTKANQPPNIPTITGSASGKPGTSYGYDFITTDPESGQLYYFIDWGDGTNSSWVGPYTSGVEITKMHSWPQKGDYTIKAIAKDVYGYLSEWATLSVTMPCSYNIPFQQFWEKLFERFPNSFPILRHLMGH
jgi:hypothetical protein